MSLIKDGERQVLFFQHRKFVVFLYKTSIPVTVAHDFVKSIYSSMLTTVFLFLYFFHYIISVVIYNLHCIAFIKDYLSFNYNFPPFLFICDCIIIISTALNVFNTLHLSQILTRYLFPLFPCVLIRNCVITF